MSTQHTPGPWEVSQDIAPDALGIGPYCIRKDGWSIAYVTGTKFYTDPAHANACLLAAAPKMLAALKAALPALIRLGDFIGNEDKGGASGIGPFDRCAIVLQVRNAIDTAEGTK